jgi:hypothetical protein
VDFAFYETEVKGGNFRKLLQGSSGADAIAKLMFTKWSAALKTTPAEVTSLYAKTGVLVSGPPPRHGACTPAPWRTSPLRHKPLLHEPHGRACLGLAKALRSPRHRCRAPCPPQLPTVSNKVRYNGTLINDYFVDFLKKKPSPVINEEYIRDEGDLIVHTGGCGGLRCLCCVQASPFGLLP